MALTADDLNYLVYRYLQESGVRGKLFTKRMLCQSRPTGTEVKSSILHNTSLLWL
jgi:hypothetical protein